jgi:hypothetical protein
LVVGRGGAPDVSDHHLSVAHLHAAINGLFAVKRSRVGVSHAPHARRMTAKEGEGSAAGYCEADFDDGERRHLQDEGALAGVVAPLLLHGIHA